jgi:hypothetical protein
VNKKIDVWALRTNCNKDLGVRTEIDYFQTHFIGEKVFYHWTPPPIRIQGKSKGLRDFVSWMLSAPVVSQRAKEVLEPLISPYVEILPLIQLRGKQYYAINVLRLVICLDRKRSNIEYSPTDPSGIIYLGETFFLKGRLEDVPLFKIPETRGEVYVTRPFVDLVIKNKLAGAAFADPSKNPFEAILRKESSNVVPGVPE